MALGKQLLRIFAMALGQPEDFFLQYVQEADGAGAAVPLPAAVEPDRRWNWARPRTPTTAC